MIVTSELTVSEDHNSNKATFIPTSLHVLAIMIGTRVIMLQARPSGIFIPSRSTWDVFKSAGKAWSTFFMDKAAGERFLQRVNSGLIQISVLGSSRWSHLSVFALQHDLENPQLQKINVTEFLEGVKPALTNFHDILGNIGNRELDELLTATKLKNIDSTESTDMQERRLLQQGSIEQDVTKLDLGKWDRQATVDPESLSAQLREMVTPEYFALLEIISMSTVSLISSKYQDGSSQLHNVALLSARTLEFPIEDDNDNIENDDKSSNNIKEEIVVEVNANAAKPNVAPAIDAAAAASADSNATTATSNTSKDVPNSRVVAQMEVVYEQTQSMILLRQGFLSNHNTATTDGGNSTTLSEGEVKEEASPKDDNDDEEEEDDKVVLRTNVLVGVFEGWLQGDPSGNENLRWRLCASRPAWEFPESS